MRQDRIPKQVPVSSADSLDDIQRIVGRPHPGFELSKQSTEQIVMRVGYNRNKILKAFTPR